jgi:hypothetical protein
MKLVHTSLKKLFAYLMFFPGNLNLLKESALVSSHFIEIRKRYYSFSIVRLMLMDTGLSKDVSFRKHTCFYQIKHVLFPEKLPFLVGVDILKISGQ